MSKVIKTSAKYKAASVCTAPLASVQHFCPCTLGKQNKTQQKRNRTKQNKSGAKVKNTLI